MQVKDRSSATDPDDFVDEDGEEGEADVAPPAAAAAQRPPPSNTGQGQGVAKAAPLANGSTVGASLTVQRLSGGLQEGGSGAALRQ